MDNILDSLPRIAAVNAYTAKKFIYGLVYFFGYECTAITVEFFAKEGLLEFVNNYPIKYRNCTVDRYRQTLDGTLARNSAALNVIPSIFLAALSVKMLPPNQTIDRNLPKCGFLLGLFVASLHFNARLMQKIITDPLLIDDAEAMEELFEPYNTYLLLESAFLFMLYAILVIQFKFCPRTERANLHQPVYGIDEQETKISKKLDILIKKGIDLDSPDAEAKYGIPRDFMCPLSLNIMRDPVTLESGNVYERRQILAWQQYNTSDPLTRQQLGHDKLNKAKDRENQISEFIDNLILNRPIEPEEETEALLTTSPGPRRSPRKMLTP